MFYVFYVFVQYCSLFFIVVSFIFEKKKLRIPKNLFQYFNILILLKYSNRFVVVLVFVGFLFVFCIIICVYYVHICSRAYFFCFFMF